MSDEVAPAPPPVHSAARRRSSSSAATSRSSAGSRPTTARTCASTLIAGVVSWGVMVPVAMAYAGLAGVPPELGLVTAFTALDRVRDLRDVAPPEGHRQLVDRGHVRVGRRGHRRVAGSPATTSR